MRRLYSTADSRKKTDALVTNWRQTPPETMIDCTIAGPLLPKYAASAATSGLAIFRDRAKAKTDKHGLGCAASNRQFIPLVITTFGGVGSTEFLDWFDAAYGAAIAHHVAAGGSGRDIADRKQAAIMEAQAGLHNATVQTVSSFSDTGQHPR